MRKNQIIAVVAAIAVLLSGGALEAVEYFPSDPDAVFDYTYGPVTIVELASGEFARVICGGCIVGASNVYLVDAAGDVYETQFGYFAQAAPDPDAYLYSSGLLYLDFPLETGKEWESTADMSFYLGGLVDTVTLRGRVTGPKTVTVPAGDFEVIEVELRYEYALESWPASTQVLWLHRQLGPVNGLESWTGVIPAEKTSWGAVKAAYR